MGRNCKNLLEYQVIPPLPDAPQQVGKLGTVSNRPFHHSSRITVVESCNTANKCKKDRSSHVPLLAGTERGHAQHPPHNPSIQGMQAGEEVSFGGYSCMWENIIIYSPTKNPHFWGNTTPTDYSKTVPVPVKKNNPHIQS